MVGSGVGGGGKQVLYLEAGYSLRESQVDAQTEAATSKKHCWRRPISFQALPGKEDVTSPAL